MLGSIYSKLQKWKIKKKKRKKREMRKPLSIGGRIYQNPPLAQKRLSNTFGYRSTEEAKCDTTFLERNEKKKRKNDF